MGEVSQWKDTSLDLWVEKIKRNGLRLFSQKAGDVNNRARIAGQNLSRLASVWAALSILGAIIMLFIKECADTSDYGCLEYERPYVIWAIVSLLANLMVASLMRAIGTYIEAKMSSTATN